MRKLSFCLLMLFLKCDINYAQSATSVGIKGGISIPNLKSSGDNPISSGWSSRQGPYFGAIAEINLSEHFCLRAELNYSSQGGKKNGKQVIPVDPYLYAVYDNEVKLNYLELPLLIKINLPINERYSFFINGGPYGGYLLSAKSVTAGLSNIYSNEDLTQPTLPAPVSFDASTDVKDQIKNFNFGIQGGIGFSYRMSSKAQYIFLTAGGNYGLIHIQRNEADGKNNTGAVTITIGYQFGL